MLGFTFQAQAALTGTVDSEDNGCISVFPFFIGFDCSYNDSNAIPIGAPGIPSYIGPVAAGSYNTPGGFVANPAVTARLPITMDLTVTGAGIGATLSGSIVIGAGERAHGCNQSPVPPPCLETWTSITHTLAPAAMNIAVVNGAGGFDYEMTTFGVPGRLAPCLNLGFFPFICTGFGGITGVNFSLTPFPSPTASLFFIPGTAWTYPVAGLDIATIGFAPAFTKNIGTTTTAVVAGRTCSGGTGLQCPNIAGFGGTGGLITNSFFNGAVGKFTSTPGLENLQCKVSTNATGAVINAVCAYANEYDTLSFFPFIPHPDSWSGGFMTSSAIRAAVRNGGNNDVKVDGKNVLPITIYGSASFDVTTIDAPGLTFGHAAIVASPSSPPTVADKDGDGEADLTAHFRTKEADLRCGERLPTLHGTSTSFGSFDLAIAVTGEGKACP